MRSRRDSGPGKAPADGLGRGHSPADLAEAVFTLRADEASVRRVLNGRTIVESQRVDSEHFV